MKVNLNFEDAEEELKTVAEILYKLRYNTKEWERLYGAYSKRVKKYWEEKADEWIDRVIKED